MVSRVSGDVRRHQHAGPTRRIGRPGGGGRTRPTRACPAAQQLDLRTFKNGECLAQVSNKVPKKVPKQVPKQAPQKVPNGSWYFFGTFWGNFIWDFPQVGSCGVSLWSRRAGVELYLELYLELPPVGTFFETLFGTSPAWNLFWNFCWNFI